MPEKYHIETTHIPPRLPRIGKYGIIDWREDCARCHNCVKKACIYDKYRQENKYIKSLDGIHTIYFECMGCFSCVQNCTKGLLCLTVNPEYKKLGNEYWTPEILRTTWLQAETGKVPVSGAGYRGKFYGPGFDSMWTDMSEIVRPTRDGIHGREYISTAVDIGRKPSFLSFSGDKMTSGFSSLLSLPFPVIFDLPSPDHSLPRLEPFIIEAARRTGLITLLDSAKWALVKDYDEIYLSHIAFHLNPDNHDIPDGILKKTRLAEIPYSNLVNKHISMIKNINPEIVVSVRLPLTSRSIDQSLELTESNVEVIHLVADLNGNEVDSKNPRFIKDMIRDIHGRLIKNEKRDEITIIAGGGIGLPEHLAKALICGADLVSVNLPLLIALECRLCSGCKPGDYCPADLDKDIDIDYAAGRITNLMGAWHWQLVEVMGAMGMREARRLRGDVGRAMFYEELQNEIYGPIFST